MIQEEIFPWSEYELIDSGGFEKIERFGDYTLIRPEPQAIWDPKLNRPDWDKWASAQFKRDNTKGSHRDVQNLNGGWTFNKKMPHSWNIAYPKLKLKMRLACTSFGHLGLFPEQLSNWHFIDEQVKRVGSSAKVLNLFGYTGAAGIVAAQAGADVTHVDAVKNVVTWANENRQLSNAPEMRWIVEDALKYVKREVSRGKKYQGIILDPPAYGRGPKGEKWILEENLNELVQLSSQLLEKSQSFLLLNLYSMGLSGTIGVNLIEEYFGKRAIWGESLIHPKKGYPLPLCTWVRLEL